VSAAEHTVLVVDDDFDIRDSLRDVLIDEGFRVEVAADGLEALAILRRLPRPSVILLDWMMPRCDGPAFLSERQKDPALADIPVILLSALAGLDGEARRLAVADYLRKPVDLDVLINTVARHCPACN
jgi:two-component system response regulator MprA